MLCRLCLIESTEMLSIFENDGERFKIADVIGQHFWFVPRKDDHLSNICRICWLKIDSFHQFYCFVQDAQKKLSEIVFTNQKSTRDYLKKENDDNDDWMYDTAVNEYVNVIQNDIEIEDIKIKSENHDNVESRCDKFKEVEDPIDIDYTNQNNDIAPKIRSATCSNDNLISSCKNKIPSKTRLKNSDKKKRGRPKKWSCNTSGSELPLPLKNFGENKPKMDMNNDNEKIKSERFIENKSKRDKNEKSEYLEKNKQRDSIIAKYMILKCEICSEELTTFAQIIQHYRTTHNTKGYVVCFCCSKKMYEKYLLLDHINKHLNPEYFKCSKCDKTFADSKSLKSHMSKHYSNNSKSFECDNCSKKFMSKILLSQHKLIHIPLEERQFICNDCGKAFATNYLLKAHHRNTHQNGYGKMCHICAKVIHGKSLFEKHQLEHAGIVESGIECNECGAHLKNKYSLKRHTYLLHNESLTLTAHKCEICEKLLKTKDALRNHMRYVHESKRSYQCGICDKAFKVEKTLKEHMAIHTGEILYTCPHCPKTFNCNANMYSHRKKKHRKEWEETRKDRYVRALPANRITSDIFKDNKSSKGDIIGNNSHQMNENETNTDNTYNEQNFISLVLD